MRNTLPPSITPASDGTPATQGPHRRAHARHHRTALSLVGFAAAAMAFAPLAAQASSSGGSADDTLATPWAQRAPSSAFTKASPEGTTTACTLPDGRRSSTIHCYDPGQIRSYYGVDQLPEQGEGQTIVLIDSYGSPTAVKDVNTFAKQFHMPVPDVEQVFPLGKPGFLSGDGTSTGHGKGQAGPVSAAGWAGEANLDVQWSYAIAPKAHIVLVGTPVAETQGVQGLPNMMKAIDWAINKYPSGTVFSMSFGTDESAFAGAARAQFARFDQTFKRGLAKGDTFFASSGDNGTLGVTRAHGGTAQSPIPQVSYPNVSPYVTSVGGTQLQDGWTWDPTGEDRPYAANGSRLPAYWAFLNKGTTEAVGDEPAFSFGTGGGLSHVYPRPAYQDSVKSVVGAHRGVPDVAWNMAINGGVLVYSSFFPKTQGVGWNIYGGTSASSPQMAALTALANEARAKAKEGPIGNLNAAIYANGFDTTGAFRDIVPITYGKVPSGVRNNNQMWDLDAGGILHPVSVPGFPTTPGYDLTTGFGSPKAVGFVNALVK